MDASNIESFNAAAMETVNAMPAPTWHRLRVNNEKIALPDGLEASSDIEFEIDNIELGESGAFDAALSTFQHKLDARNEGKVDTRAVVAAAGGDVNPGNLIFLPFLRINVKLFLRKLRIAFPMRSKQVWELRHSPISSPFLMAIWFLLRLKTLSVALRFVFPPKTG